MFKKTKIAAATIALLGAAAVQNVSAVSFDDAGDKAQVLIFPYYNVNNNFQTAINIRNTKNEYKAVKIRFRESKYSNDVLDFNLYMSPYDHWSATIALRNGKASIQSADTTCTFPRAGGAVISKGDVVPFIGDVYKNTSNDDAKEGYVEVIEMGNINPTLKPDGTFATSSGGGVGGTFVTADLATPPTGTIAAGLKHVNSTSKPGDCEVLATAWGSVSQTTGLDTTVGAHAFHQSGSYKTNTVAPGAAVLGNTVINPAGGTFYEDNAVTGLTAPTGGLQGFSYLLDLVNGTAFTGDPVAIANYSTIPQHYRPDSIAFYLLPSLASGNVLSSAVADNTLNDTKVNIWGTVAKDWGSVDPESEFAAFPTVKAQGSGINPFPMADVLAATAVTNDFITNPATKTETDWVLTFPMRKHGILNGWDYDGVARTTAALGGTGTTLITASQVDGFKAVTGFSGIQFGTRIFNREENELTAPTTSGSYSPPLPTVSVSEFFPREVNIINFTAQSAVTSSLLGSPAAKVRNPGTFTSGWAEFSFPTASGANNNSNIKTVAEMGTPDWASVAGVTTSVGVPSMGFSAMRGAYSGNLATDIVGETARHVFTRSR